MGVLEEMFKQGLYTGLGLALKAGDLFADLGSDVIEVTKTSQEEGRIFFEKLMRRTSETQSIFGRQEEEKIKEKLAKLNIATQDDLLRLKAQITRLELLLKEKGIITESSTDSSAAS